VRRRWFALLVLASCSGPSSSAPPTSPTSDHRGEAPPDLRHTHGGTLPVGGIDEGAPVPACPPESDLVPRLRELWEVPPDASVDLVACTRGRFRTPGWLIDAFIDTSDEDSEERIEVLRVDGGGVIAARQPSSSAAADRFDTGAGDGWEVADLDADGIDELLQLQEWNQVAVTATTLAVFRLDGARIVEVGTLRLAYDNTGAKAMTASRTVQCSSQHALSDGADGIRHILVEGTIARTGRQAGPIAGSSCPLPGAHRYQLVGGKLEEVKP